MRTKTLCKCHPIIIVLVRNLTFKIFIVTKTSLFNFRAAAAFGRVCTFFYYFFINISKCTSHGKSEKGSHKGMTLSTYHLKFNLPKIFKNSRDFKKFYAAFHHRVCNPKTEKEEEWFKALFVPKKGKSVPVYDLQVCLCFLSLPTQRLVCL